jgi:hypothetical protein
VSTVTLKAGVPRNFCHVIKQKHNGSISSLTLQGEIDPSNYFVCMSSVSSEAIDIAGNQT